MRAIHIGDDDENTLEWAETETPTVSLNTVLVRVRATAVNRADLLQRKGLYPPPPGASEILGLEAAGEVVEVGDEVQGVEVGDRVCCLLAGGGSAEYVEVHAGMLLDVPADMSFVEAAAIPEVFYTAYLNLVIEAELGRSETILLHAAASGVGTAAIQICKLWDAAVIGTASAPKLERLREMGVQEAIDRKSESFRERVDELTDGRGVDVILDPVGGNYLEDNVASLATRGRMVLIGLLGGRSGELDLGRLLVKRLRVIGSVLRSRSLEEKLEITRRFREDVWPHFESGDLEPIVDRTFPIERANDAHELIRSNETFGKVVLTVAADSEEQNEERERE